MKLGIVCGSRMSSFWQQAAKEAGAEPSICSPLDSTSAYDALWILDRPAGASYRSNLPALTTVQTVNKDPEDHRFVSFPLRHRPEIRHLRDIAYGAKLGQIGTIRLSLCRSAQLPGALFYNEIPGGSGALRQLGPHAFDAIQWCFGPIDRVHAVQSSESRDAAQYALVAFKMASEAIGHLELSLSEPSGGDYIAYEIAGANGILEYDSRKEPLLALHSRQQVTQQQITPPELVAELRDFITGSTQKLVPAAESESVSRLLEQAVQSTTQFTS